MKKSFKLIALFLAIVMLSVSLCSCRALDDAKENRAVYTSADRTEIEYKDSIYRLINSGKFSFVYDGYYSPSNYNVCDKEVPVLLAGMYGDWMYVNKDETVIQAYNTDQDFVGSFIDNMMFYGSPYDDSTYYVREDKYDEIKKVIESAKLDSYYIEYWDYSYDWSEDLDDDDWDDYDLDDLSDEENYHRMVKLDEDVAKIINKARTATIKDKVSYKELSNSEQNMIYLSACDSNMIITDINLDCRLVQDKDKYYFWNGETSNEYSLVPLNKEDSAVVAKLFAKYPDAIYEEYIAWGFDYDDDYDYDYDYEDVDTKDVFI